MASSEFSDRLRFATTGDPTAALAYLGNFEVEDVWAADETSMPRVASTEGRAIVNRMDEFAIWLGGAGDTALLKAEPDPDYLDGLRGQGFDIPMIVTASSVDRLRNITQDLIVSDDLGGGPRTVLPHAMSEFEEQLLLGREWTAAAPPAELSKRVNSKVYSRTLADEQGILQAPGATSRTLDDWGPLIETGHRLLEAGHSIVLKEAFGVSGKGIAVVRDPSRLDRLAGMISRRAERNDGRAAFCLETWLPKHLDLNYQFTLARDGTMTFDSVKLAVTSNGVHRGHRFPVQLTSAHRAEIDAAASAVAARLAHDGYFGVVGVDALIDTAGTLYPILEINARLNMATYQAAIDETVLGRGAVSRAKHFDLALQRPIGYAEMHDVLGSLMFTASRGQGLVVNNYATVNAAFDDDEDHGGDERQRTPGRLYGVLIGDDDLQLDVFDAAIEGALAGAGHGSEVRS